MKKQIFSFKSSLNPQISMDFASVYSSGEDRCSLLSVCIKNGSGGDPPLFALWSASAADSEENLPTAHICTTNRNHQTNQSFPWWRSAETIRRPCVPRSHLCEMTPRSAETDIYDFVRGCARFSPLPVTFDARPV